MNFTILYIFQSKLFYCSAKKKKILHRYHPTFLDCLFGIKKYLTLELCIYYALYRVYYKTIMVKKATYPIYLTYYILYSSDSRTRDICIVIIFSYYIHFKYRSTTVAALTSSYDCLFFLYIYFSRSKLSRVFLFHPLLLYCL